MVLPRNSHNFSAINKLEFPHLMLKEIHQQPEAIRTCLSHYLSGSGFVFNFPDDFYINLEQIQIVASGTSRHAGLVAQHWFEQITGIPTRVRFASEFIIAPLPLRANTLTIAITQSGETADTLAAIRLQKQRSQSEPRSWLLGITNNPESSLAECVDYLLPTDAGKEIGVAATKTFTTQLIVLLCLVLNIATQQQKLKVQKAKLLVSVLVNELQQIPEKIADILQSQLAEICTLAEKLAQAQHCVLLGQGVNQPIALEGALKLKENTYIHAEGYAAGEFLHGSIALLDHRIPVIAILPCGNAESSILTTTQKAKLHSSLMIGIAPELLTVADHTLIIPTVHEQLSPLLTVIPLQLLAYQVAVIKGLNVDRPRNITKTVMSQ